MKDNGDPIVVLRDLMARGASGEIVAAGDELEVHMHVYRGRLAWATSTAASGNLVSYLLEHGELDRDVLREVVAECRNGNKRFGETLVEWGVADPAIVRNALAAQIREALDSLRYTPGLRTLFLPRNGAYSDELTFALDEVWQEEDCGTADGAQLQAMAADLGRAVPHLMWVEVVRASGTEMADGPTGAPTTSQALHQVSAAIASAGGRAATLRCSRGALVGRAVREFDSWLWCALPSTANLGLAKAVLATVAPRGSTRPPMHLARTWTTEGDSNSPVARILEQAFGKSEELVATAVSSAQGTHTRVCRLDCDGAALTGHADRVTEAIRAALSTIFPGEQAPEHARMPLASCHMEDGLMSHFAATMDHEPTGYLWLVLHPGASPGFGWALLTTLVRQMREECAPATDGSAPAPATAQTGGRRT
jgi:hypothetical protein